MNLLIFLIAITNVFMTLIYGINVLKNAIANIAIK